MALSTHLQNLAESVSEVKGANITLLVSEGYPDNRSHPNLEIYESKTNLYNITGHLQFFLWTIIQLARIGKKGSIDAIHCLYPFSSTLACLVYKLIFSRRTKVLYDIRSPWIEMSMRRGRIQGWMKGITRLIANALERILLKSIDGAIFITDGLRDYYLKMGFLLPDHCHVYPSAVDTKQFTYISSQKLRQNLGLGLQDPVIGYVGGIAKTRYLDFLIDGFEKLQSQSDEKWALVFIGDGDDEERLKSIARAKNLENVYFYGRVDHSEVPSLISNLTIGVCHLPNTTIFNTSFPLKVLEYLSCGIPALVSDMPAHRDLAKTLSGVALYNYDSESFSRMAVHCMENCKAKQEEVENYSWARIAKGLVNFYRSCVYS
jgi:glycosyltransferase involved in cell wall biosynthesis